MLQYGITTRPLDARRSDTPGYCNGTRLGGTRCELALLSRYQLLSLQEIFHDLQDLVAPEVPFEVIGGLVSGRFGSQQVLGLVRRLLGVILVKLFAQLLFIK